MNQSHCRHHAAALGVSGREDTPAHAIFEWYRKTAEALPATRDAVYGSLRGGQEETIVGPIPTNFDDEDETPVFVLLDRAIDRIRTLMNELVNETNAEYFERLRQAYPARVDDIDRLERSWRRERRFADFRSYFGANVDLVRVADETIGNRAVRDSLDAILDEWEAEVDAALAAHERAQEDWRQRHSDVREKTAAGEADIDDMAEVFVEPMLAQVRVLRMHERAVSRIRAELDNDEDALRAFERGWYEGKYPFIWTRRDELSPLERLLEREGLPPADREALLAMRNEIERLRETATSRLDALQKPAISESYLREQSRAHAQWYIDRTRPQTDTAPDDAFVEEGRKFLKAMEAIGARISQIERRIVEASRGGEG